MVVLDVFGVLGAEELSLGSWSVLGIIEVIEHELVQSVLWDESLVPHGFSQFSLNLRS